MSALFYVRNTFSLIAAESIIKKNNYKDNIMIVHDSNKDIFSIIKKYYSKDKWKKIEKSSFYQIQFKKSKFYNNISKEIKQKKHQLKQLIKKNNVMNLFLIKPYFPEQNLYYEVCKEIDNIKIFDYEEGTNYYTDDLIDDRDHILRKCIVGLRNLVLYFFNKEVYSVLKRKKKLRLDGKYNLLNCGDFSKNYNLILPKLSNDKFSKIKNLYLSRPLSEDGWLSWEEEKMCLNHIIPYVSLDDTLYVKFHPRDSREKRSLLKNFYNKRNIKIEILELDIPAEIIAYNLKNDVKIFGFETGTLIYASELLDKDCYSLLKIAQKYDKKGRLQKFYNLYKSNFEKINYID